MPNNFSNDLNEFISINEAARLLKVSSKTLRRWEKKGVLNAHRTEGGHRRYKTRDIIIFKKSKARSKTQKRETPTKTAYSINTTDWLIGGIAEKKAPKSFISTKKILTIGASLFFLFTAVFTAKAAVLKFNSIKSGIDLKKTAGQFSNVLAEKINLKDVEFNISVPSKFENSVLINGDATISASLTTGTLRLTQSTITSAADLNINADGGAVIIGGSTGRTIDASNGDLFVSDQIEAGASFVLNGEVLSDFTGSGLVITAGSLNTTLGSSINPSEIDVTNTPSGGQILSYDSETGNFKWKADEAGDTSPFKTSSSVVSLVTATNDVTIGSTTDLGKFAVVGDSDEVQILAQAASGQTNDVFVVEKSDGTNIFSIDAEGSVSIKNTSSNDITIDLSSTGDFNIQSAGSTYATFTDNGVFTLDNLRLDGNTLSTTTGNLVLSASGSVILNGFDCTGFTNGGALTADASGVISCSNDDGGGGTSDWTSGSSVVYLQSTTNNVNIGGTANLGKLAVDGDTDEIQLLVQGNSTQNSFLAVFEQSTGTDVFTIANNGNLVSAGDAAINGGDITTTSTSATIFNTNATTIEFGKAGTSISIGANSGTTTFNHDVVINGTLTTAASNFAADGASTFSPSGTNDVTMNLDSDSTLILNGVQSGTASNGLCLDSSNNVITCSAPSSITLQTAYANDINGSDTIIALTSSDDSLVFRNPAASGTDSSYVLQIDQLANAAVDTLRLTQSGTGVVLDATSGSTGKLLNLTTTGAATTADAVFIEATNAGGVITDAIDVSDSEIVNAINIGANTIAGTTGIIDFTNFDVDASGNITINGSADLTIGSIGLNDTGSNNTTAGASLVGVYGEFANSSSTNVQDVLDDLDAAITGSSYGSWTLAGDSGSNQTISSGNTASILGGTNGVDTVGSATDTLTINLDTTEIGTNTFGSGSGITWTFDASSGTDTTIAFGNNTQTFTTATATFSGNATIQGTTGLTLSGSGADLTFANSESITNDTNNQFNFKRNDAGAVTITAEDDDTTAALTILPGGAAALTLGGSSTTAITLTTDSTGDGEIVLPANSIGNSELVNSGITFSGDSGSSSTTLGGTRTIAGGTNGIDTSESTGTITINLDTTEIGTTSFGSGSSFTWTFDASAGTDTTLAFGNNLATFTGNTFTVASSTTNADSLAIVPQSSTATNSFTGTITSDDLTANRTFTFPNATGTVCLTSGNCAGVGGSIAGSGTSGQIAYFDGASSITSEATGFSWDATNNKLGIGTDSPTSKLHVTGAVTGKALAIFDETGDQNILVASASGTTVARIDRSGQLTLNTQTANADKIALIGNATGANTFTGSLTTADLTANRTFTLPDATGTICLTSGNCAGVGGIMSSFNIAGDSGSDSVSDGQTVTIAGGTNGIDTSESGRTVTINLDTTEIGSTTFGSGSGITWTFDASAGTDTTIAFGNNTQTFTTGTATFSGDLTVQGGDITLNTAGTIVPSGAGTITIGNSNLQSLTVTTDSTGDSEVVLPASSIGNSELVNSGITFAGDSGSSSTSLGGTRTIAGGTNGIDTSESTGTVTLNLDATEIGTTTFGSGSGITWTFDASAGTDTTIAFGNNTQTFTTGTATFSGDLTVQGGDVAGANSAAIDLGEATTGAITFTAGTTGDYVFGTDDDTNFQITQSAAPGVDMLAITDGGNNSTTDNVDGISLTFGVSAASGSLVHLTPSYADGTAGATSETFNIIDIDAFTATQNASGDTGLVRGVNIGNLTQTESAGTITASALRVGTGWDDILSYNGTQIISGTGVLQSTALSGTYSNALTLSSTSNAFTGTIGQSTPLAGSFTGLTSTGTTTLGNNSATVAVNSSDWDISTTGDISGAGAITADGAIAFTPGSTSDITFTLDSDSTLILSGVQSGTATNGLCLDTDNNVITCSTSSAVTLQTAYGNDTDTGDTIIALTTADDSLIFRNPAASGTDSSFLLKLDQLATGAVDGLNIAQAGTGTGITLSFSNSGTTADGLLINNSAGTLTDAIDVSDATGFTNAINVGANKILGTTGAIDYTNFDVATSGLITVAVGTGLDTNAAGALNLGTTNATSAVIGSSSLTSLTVTTDGTGNAEVALPTGSIGSGEILDNTIDWTDIIDSSTLDAATAIAFGGSTYTFTFTNNGSGNEIHNLTSSGDLVIQDNGSSMATFSDASVITLFPANGTVSGGNVLIDGATTDSTLSSTSTGVFGITVDASISGASSTNYGFYIDYQAIDDSDSSDTFIAQRIDLTGSSVDNDAVYGLYINNVNDASGAATDSLLVLENNDANTAVTSGILFGAGGANSPDFTTGIDFSSATFTTELKFQNGETLDNATNSMFTFATNTSNADTIIVAPNVTASASTFAGTLTSADLTAARTWTLPDATGTICVSGQACALTGTVTSSGSTLANKIAYFTTDSNITGSANFTFDPTVTTTDMVAIANNSQTAEDLISLSNSSASQSTNKFINITQTGVTTGYTGNLLSLSSTSTTGAATFLSVAANSSTVGTLAALSGTSLTSGTGLSITGGAANQTTTGELIDLVAGASTAGAGVRITSTGVYTGTAATDGLVNVVANSLTTGDGSKFSFTGLTSGTGVEIVGSGATMATGGELLDLNLGATTVGAGVTITSTGAYTGTGSADGLINVVANSLTTGDGSKFSFTGLTSGTGIEIIGGTSMTTNGELLDLNMGAATAGNGINITTTGAYTGTGLSVLTANTATTGVLSQITGNALTTGRLLSLDSSSTALTTGATISNGGTATGSLLNIASTGVLTAFTGNLTTIDWSPTSAATVTGDLFHINVGSNGSVGNLLNISDAGTSLFAVSESQITSSVPHQFTAAGDVAVAYDLQFTNQTSSFIKSNAPLTIEAGESYESNNLTLQTYNSGQVVVASVSGQLKMDVQGFIEANLNHSTSSTEAVCGTSGAENAADSILDDCTTSVSADYAEVYPSESDVTYGDVVMAGPNSITIDHTSVDKDQTITSNGQFSISKVAKSQSAYQTNVIGVVSNNWSDFSSTGAYAVPQDQNPLPVALSGRVPVKIADSSDPINPGDYVTTSNVPGKAMKATNSGRVIGMALGKWTPGQGQQAVLIFINNTWFESTTQTAQGNEDTRLTALENSFDTVVRESLTASDSGILALFSDVKTNTLSVLGDTVLSDTVVNGKLNVGALTLDNTDQSINAVGTLKIQSLALGNIELQGGLVTIDTLGNIVVNTITAQKYKVAGASAGVGNLPGGTTEIFITTDQVSANSLIFVTAKQAISHPLSVTEKQEGVGFKVSVTQSDLNDVAFDWFIVDKQ